MPVGHMTFSAPKSVSVMILLGDDKALDRAHDKAVQRAMDYTREEPRHHPCPGEGGGRTNRYRKPRLRFHRPWDVSGRRPQRHTHVVVANMTYDQEAGQWRALESREIYRNQVLLTKIYQAELAKEAMALGYDIRKGEGPGTLELDAWTRSRQLGAFSKRAQTIQAAFEAEAKSTQDNKKRELTGAEKERLRPEGPSQEA